MIFQNGITASAKQLRAAAVHMLGYKLTELIDAGDRIQVAFALCISPSKKAEAASAMPQSGCRWSMCSYGRKACNGVSIDAATVLLPNAQSGYIATISSSNSTRR